LDLVYRREILNLIDKIPSDFFKLVESSIRGYGYDVSVVLDEIHAHLSTLSMSEMEERFGGSVEIPWQAIANIQKYSDEFVDEFVTVNEQGYF
jgi:NADH/NAD ratio-sensing transcriptional regulator Rex